jgi:hypothetical protein
MQVASKKKNGTGEDNMSQFSCMLPKRHVLTSYFLALKYDHMMGTEDNKWN